MEKPEISSRPVERVEHPFMSFPIEKGKEALKSTSAAQFGRDRVEITPTDNSQQSALRKTGQGTVITAVGTALIYSAFFISNPAAVVVGGLALAGAGIVRLTDGLVSSAKAIDQSPVNRHH